MQRVAAALKGQPADRRAWTMTLSLYGAKLTGCPLSEYYTRPERYVQGQVAVAEHVRPDIIFAPFALALEAQAFGSDIVCIPKNPPTVKKPFIRSPDEMGRLQLPHFQRQAGLRYLQTCAKGLADHFKDSVPVCGILSSPMDLPAIIMGVEGWLELLLFDRQKLAEMTALMAEYFVGMANAMFDSGIAFLAMPMMFANPRLVFEKTIAEVVVPALAEVFAKLNGPVVFHHGGNPLAAYLRHYLSLPNLGGFVLDSRDDFGAARKAVGPSVLLLGNLDGPCLGKLSPWRAIQKAQAILDDRREDRHFIFASSAADVAWDTPLSTIAGIRALVEKDGKDHDR
jgi:uroporphyrinogen decarboxylase